MVSTEKEVRKRVEHVSHGKPSMLRDCPEFRPPIRTPHARYPSQWILGVVWIPWWLVLGKAIPHQHVALNVVAHIQQSGRRCGEGGLWPTHYEISHRTTDPARSLVHAFDV